MTDFDQRPLEDTLLDSPVADALDEGYSPPERLPSTHSFGTTAEEQRHGESWDQRLLQEEPDVDPSMVPEPREDELEVIVRGTARTGRLLASDEGVREDSGDGMVARDVGIDGGAASAEEAAMHVVEEP
jgi:hypothetical protein